MKKALSGFLIAAGIVVIIGLAGSEDMAMELGAAGRSMADLLWTAVAGVVMIGAGSMGVRRSS